MYVMIAIGQETVGHNKWACDVVINGFDWLLTQARMCCQVSSRLLRLKFIRSQRPGGDQHRLKELGDVIVLRRAGLGNRMPDNSADFGFMRLSGARAF
jgi:hypothetical protein